MLVLTLEVCPGMSVSVSNVSVGPRDQPENREFAPRKANAARQYALRGKHPAGGKEKQSQHHGQSNADRFGPAGQCLGIELGRRDSPPGRRAGER